MADPKRGVAETAKVFTHGGSQAVRLPKAFRFADAEVSIRREGDSVILTPKPKGRPLPKTKEDWDRLWAELDALTDEPFPNVPEQELDSPPEPW